MRFSGKDGPCLTLCLVCVLNEEKDGENLSSTLTVLPTLSLVIGLSQLLNTTILVLFSCFFFTELGRIQWLQFIFFQSYISIGLDSQILRVGVHNFLTVLLQGLLGWFWATHYDRWFLKSEQQAIELSLENHDVKLCCQLATRVNM